MSEQEYTVTVTGPGLEFSRAADETTALSIITAAMSGHAVGSDDKQKPAEDPQTEVEMTESTERVAINEFLVPLNTPGNAERIAGILLFAKEQLGKERVPVSDLLESFQRAGLSPPKNLSRDVGNAVKKGVISEDTKHTNEFFVTQTGIQALRGAGSSTGGKSSRPPSPPPGRSSDAELSSTAHESDTGARKKSELKPKRRQRSASASGPGPIDRARSLVAEGWFVEPRTVKDLVDELARKGAHYKASDFAWAMQNLVQSDKLSRDKQPDAKGRSVWHYTGPGTETSTE